MSFSVLGPCELAATTDDMCHGFCMLFAQPASWILHSVVVIVGVVVIVVAIVGVIVVK